MAAAAKERYRARGYISPRVAYATWRMPSPEFRSTREPDSRAISAAPHPPVVDDRAVGLVLRALRRRRRWRQADLAERAGCSQALVSQIERGHVGRSTVDTVRQLFGAVDGRLQLAPRWRGAELDRLLDAEHAVVVGALAGTLERVGWNVLLEVTYSEFGERGSIDVLGLHPESRSAFVGEVKTDVASSEAVARALDAKGRLAATVVRRLEGWRPELVAQVLVFPESPRLRRLLASSPVLARRYPIDSRRVRGWLRQPAGPLQASWFLTNITPGNPRRVRTPGTSPSRRSAAGYEATLSVDSVASVGERTLLR